MTAAQPSAAIYLRVSTEGQTGDDSFGLGTQEAACRAYAQRQGLAVRRVYSDVITGTSVKRQGFTQLLGDLGAYQAVIVYAVDRLARSVPAAYVLAQEIADAGAELHSASEGRLEVSGDGQGIAFGLHALLADAERRRITQRMAAGKRQKVIEGQPLRPLFAYGYENGQVVPAEAEKVNLIFNAALGMGMRSLQKHLSDLGIANRSGQPFTGDGLRKLLRNGIYRGEYIYGRERATRQATATSVTAPCPAIVEPELWYAVNRALDRRSTGAGRRGSRTDRFPLQGRTQCSVCGSAMVGMVNARHGKAYTYYTCGDRYLPKHRAAGCEHRKFYPSTDVHDAVWQALRDLRDEPATLDQVLARPEPTTFDVSAELADIDRQLERARAAYQRGIDSIDEYGAAKAGLTERREKLVKLRDEGLSAPRVSPELALRSLVQALTLDDLHAVAVQLGLLVTFAPGGDLTMVLDPV